MSLTSYRAAPPRGNLETVRKREVYLCIVFRSMFCRPGGGLLSRALRRSIIAAGGFNGRVRDGIG